jgi:hypothetical protein
MVNQEVIPKPSPIFLEDLVYSQKSSGKAFSPWKKIRKE